MDGGIRTLNMFFYDTKTLNKGKVTFESFLQTWNICCAHHYTRHNFFHDDRTCRSVIGERDVGDTTIGRVAEGARRQEVKDSEAEANSKHEGSPSSLVFG